MTLPIVLRPTTLEDAPDITNIYAHAVLYGTASFEEAVPTIEEIRGRMAGLLEAGFPYLVAISDGTVVGYAYAGPYRTRSAYRFSVEDSIYLAPDQQRRGIGAVLLNGLIARCQEKQFHRMIGVIGDPDTNQASVKLHRRAGFTDVGRFRQIGYKFGQWRDSLLMERPLR